MTCTVTRQTPAVAFQNLLNNFSASVLGGSPVIPESNEWYVVANDFAAQQEIYSILDQQLKELDPRTACCDNLLSIAAVDGMYPKAAIPSQGYVKISGTAGSAIPSPLDILIGENTFRVVGTIPLTMPAIGYVNVRVQALVPGLAGNTIPSSGIGFTTVPSPGLLRRVFLYGTSFCSGADAETCEAFRTRYLARKAYQPRATLAWLKEKILEWPCVTRVFVRAGNCCDEDCLGGCACTECGSKMEFYALFDNTFECGIPSDCIIQDMNTWLFGEVPGRGQGQVEIGVCGQIYLPVSSKVNVVIDGVNCATPGDLVEIRSRIEELFLQAEPSQDFYIRQIELAVAQVLGVSTSAEISFSIVSGSITLDDCGNLSVPCDVLPCLNEVVFTTAGAIAGGCIE